MRNQVLSNEQLVARAPSIGATQPHKSMSDRYSYVGTLPAINYLRDAGWQPIDAQEVKARRRVGFQTHLVRFSKPDLVLDGRRLDLLMYNSHAGQSSFRLLAGIYEFVCSNGLVVGDKLAEFRHRHVGFHPDRFIESAQQLEVHLGNTVEVIDQWGAIDLVPDEQGVFARAAHRLVWEPDTAPVEPDQLLTTRRRHDSDRSLWSTYNRVQENLTQGGLKGRAASGRRVTTRRVTSLEKDKRLNQALWILAQEMADLKSI